MAKKSGGKGWKMTAARKAYYSSKKRGKSAAGKKAFASKYKEMRAMGVSKTRAKSVAETAAFRVAPKATLKKARVYAKAVARKKYGITSKRGQKAFIKGYTNILKKG